MRRKWSIWILGMIVTAALVGAPVTANASQKNGKLRIATAMRYHATQITNRDVVLLGRASYSGSGRVVKTTNPDAQSGYVTPNPDLQSGYVTPNPDLQSGYVTPNPDLQSGYVTPNPDLQSGYVTPNPDLQIGFVTPNPDSQ